MSPTSVDDYLARGCGRCPKHGTPACKVHRFEAELAALRSLVLEAGLEEHVKWDMPCYTATGKNVAIVAAFVDYCCIAFFKGALLEDADGLLVSPGENSRAVRQLRFRSLDEVKARKPAIRRYLAEAQALEKSGAKLAKAPPTTVPDELRAALDEDPTLARAFAALTPGRQRSHALHVAGAKRASTRQERAAACAAKIRAGEGWNER